jgi:acetolactate synthase-1/2/3 large subunit
MVSWDLSASRRRGGEGEEAIVRVQTNRGGNYGGCFREGLQTHDEHDDNFASCSSRTLYAGDVGIAINPKLAARVKAADLIIAIGPRLGEMTTNGYTLLEAPRPKQTLVHIHASAEELNRVYQADLAINAGMSAAARSLEVLSAPPELPWEAWTAAANTDYLANLEPQPLPGLPADAPRGAVDMAAVVTLLQKHLPADAAITNGAGNFASWVHRFFRYHGLAKGHKTQLAPTSGAMGYGVPAGIACNLTTGRTAFTIAGDGDFLMNGQELATASQHGGKSIIVLLNNGMFGTIRMHQEREYPRNVSGTALTNPDFCALARAYGYAAEKVTATAQFEAALLRALAADTGTLIEIPLDPEVITTRGTLSAITKAAQAKGCDRGAPRKQNKKKPAVAGFFDAAHGGAAGAYLTCLPIRAASSNIETWALPKISLSLASALMLRLLALSCRLFFLM